MKPTKNMLRRASAEAETKREKAAVNGNRTLFEFVSDMFQDRTGLMTWYNANRGGIASYLSDSYAYERDFVADGEQKDACLAATEYLESRTGDGPERPVPKRILRMRALAAVCVLAMFVPGRHLGFAVRGPAERRYLLTMFGGTLDMCGKYGFGVNVFEKAPDVLRRFLDEIIRRRFYD